jgi:hypothetical protein
VNTRASRANAFLSVPSGTFSIVSGLSAPVRLFPTAVGASGTVVAAFATVGNEFGLVVKAFHLNGG